MVTCNLYHMNNQAQIKYNKNGIHAVHVHATATNKNKKKKAVKY